MYPIPISGLASRIFLCFCLISALCLTPVSALALGEDNYVDTRFKRGHFPLVGEKSRASLYVDPNDYPGVIRSLGLLQKDIESVTGQKLEILPSLNGTTANLVIVGTIGKSRILDDLVAAKKIDLDDIADQWDAFHIELVSNPLPGVKQALVIAGSNRRGTSYGIFDLSEQIGVSPWYWWADVPVAKKDKLFVVRNTLKQDMPKVKYRGIFLNDEWPGLTNWTQEKFGGYNSQFYENVFELLLRLKANFLWPAMWNNAFADDDPRNMILADEYGIVMSTSHHEPMMRADKEWNRYGKGPWEYSTNGKSLYDFWMDGAKRNKPYESVYTLGMRGQQDTPMSEGENIELLEKIVRDQRRILADVFGEDEVTKVPQVWALYKEVQGFYERGMRVPDDVILLWCDDNWGNIRRLPTVEERKRSGGAGVYYHFDYVGGPRSYRWINTVPIAKIWEQMNLAYQYDATKIWVTNVGDLKPMEFPIEFFLRMAWDPERWPKERLQEFGQLWAAREFGAEHAVEIEQLISGYTRHNGRRKPELQEPGTYSLLNYREADRVLAEVQDLSARAEALYEKLPASHRDAFYQLVLHPVKASTTITEMYDAAARNRLYAHQGRASTNHYGQKVRELFARDEELTQRYHQLNQGKWNHLMNQTRIGYTHWNHPPANTLPVIYQYEPHSEADMGVAVEGMEQAWPVPGAYALPEFSPYGQAERYIDVFNKGTKAFEFSATVSAPWIILSHTSGQVKQEERLNVSIDWNKAPKGKHSGHVHITGTGWGGARVLVHINKPDSSISRRARGFVEADGYIAIEAENYTAKRSVQDFEWQKIPLHGRTLSSMSVFPITDYSFSDPTRAPFLEYELFFFSTGEFKVEGIFAPSLPFVPGRGLRYAVGFDKEKPQIVDILSDMSDAAWEESVRTDSRRSSSVHKVSKPGLYKLRIYMVDPAVTLQKLIIDTGGLKPSYLGPQQSMKLY
jgi:hypothetical protein